MSYLVRKLTGKKTWKVQYRTYKGGRSARDIREDDFLRLGFNRSMDYQEVRLRCDQLNAQERVCRLEEKRHKITTRLKEEDLIVNAFLPEALLKEFEDNFLTGKKVSHWRSAKKLIVVIKLDQADWAFYKSKWYRLFQQNRYSLDYVQKLLYILNRWGRFVAYRHHAFFESIPAPTGIEKQSLITAYEERGVTKESLPITPHQLLNAALREDHYNWLYLSIWFGLRPGEVDQLLKLAGPRTWVVKDSCLWVYQSKLTGIATKDRLKPVPIKYQEQTEALKIITSGNFKRPLNKTLKATFGGQTTCYGGRKGFVDLMLSKGNNLEAISQWLGHRSLDRTWKNYKDKKIVLT